jgi:hypothetical protein
MRELFCGFAWVFGSGSNSRGLRRSLLHSFFLWKLSDLRYRLSRIFDRDGALLKPLLLWGGGDKSEEKCN